MKSLDKIIGIGLVVAAVSACDYQLQIPKGDITTTITTVSFKECFAKPWYEHPNFIVHEQIGIIVREYKTPCVEENHYNQSLSTALLF